MTLPPSPDLIRQSHLELLRSVVRLRVAAYCVVTRAQLVLTYLQGTSLRETAHRHQSSVSTVRRWVERWREKPGIEALRDKHRSGRNATFGIWETAKVLSIVSQSPASYGFHFASWTQELVVEALAAEGTSMSRSTVQRILARQDIDIRTVKYWLWTPRDRPNYLERRNAICGAYLAMDSLPDEEILLCFDAKPGIQILADPKNKGGSCGPRSGEPRRLEFEYRRLGTRSLVAAVDPTTGEVMHFDRYDGSFRARPSRFLRSFGSS